MEPKISESCEKKLNKRNISEVDEDQGETSQTNSKFCKIEQTKIPDSSSPQNRINKSNSNLLDKELINEEKNINTSETLDLEKTTETKEDIEDKEKTT